MRKKIQWSLWVGAGVMSVVLGVFYYRERAPIRADLSFTVTKNTWKVDFTPTFEFVINEPHRPHELFFVLKIDKDQYPFQNIWLTYYLEDIEGKQLDSRLVQYELFDQKTGKPLGAGYWKNYRYRLRLPSSKLKESRPGNLTNKVRYIEHHLFPKKGTYRIRIEQFMRTEMLSGISHVGLQVLSCDHSSR